MKEKLVKALFVVAALYDGVLGVAFLLATDRIYAWAGIAPPNHPGYVQFPALLLLVFAAMFLAIALDPRKRRELILYGCGLKIAYCATVLGHHFTGGIPGLWLPWAFADLAFLAMFVWAWLWTRKQS